MADDLSKLVQSIADWKSSSDALYDLLSASAISAALARPVLGATGFCTEMPSHQNAVDLFDNWTSQLPVEGISSGGMRLFSDEDPRPGFVTAFFGDISNFDILELGSFEGAHSYQLSRLGAKSVLGIEAQPSSYLKSLIAKEATEMSASFLLGDFTKYLEETPRRFDLIFCSGVLYHMVDPVYLLKLISQRTDRIFLWTHYVTVEQSRNWADSFDFEGHGYRCRYHRLEYEPGRYDRRYSGVEAHCCRLLQSEILGAMKAFGFNRVEIMLDQPDHPNGPAFSVIGCKTGSAPPVGAT
jgi:hypothetical protein